LDNILLSAHPHHSQTNHSRTRFWRPYAAKISI